jgi:hypothetical protein
MNCLKTGLLLQEPVSGGALDGELVGGTDNFAQDPPEITDLDEPAGYVAPLESSDLTGVEQFLTAYGVQGGVITYEDGSSARFQNLILLSRRIKFFGIRKCFNRREIQSRRRRGKFTQHTARYMTSEEFINSLVDYRMQAVSAQRELSTTDYEAVSDDGIL